MLYQPNIILSDEKFENQTINYLVRPRSGNIGERVLAPICKIALWKANEAYSIEYVPFERLVVFKTMPLFLDQRVHQLFFPLMGKQIKLQGQIAIKTDQSGRPMNGVLRLYNSQLIQEIILNFALNGAANTQFSNF